MEQKTIRKGYVSRLQMIDKKNIEDFEMLPNHRLIRGAQVERILSGLKKGTHFESQVVVNQRGRKLRLIDGGHRVTAIGEFLKLFPEKQIEVNLAVYDELDNEQELEVFGVWNKGLKQSPDDYLNLRKEEILIYKLLKNSFPCKVSIYSPGKSDGIKLKTLMDSYLGAMVCDEPNGYSARIDAFIEKCKELGHKDHKYLSRFMEGFISVFGSPSSTNAFSSYIVFNAMMRVYYDNNVWQGETYFWDKMKSSVYPSSTIRQYTLSGSARLQIKPCVDEMIRLLNKGKRTNQFLLRHKVKTTNAIIKEKVKKEDVRAFGVVDLTVKA